VRLLIQPSGAEITLPEQPEVIIGRADASSQFFPDVDLNRFDALSSGVSRRHARVTANAGQVAIEDLDTANGTAVNKQRLAPRQPRPIGDGDELRFGALVTVVRLG
jgi:pSer/pThr/pTyr-binding forkhead associated (FHA) protein